MTNREGKVGDPRETLGPVNELQWISVIKNKHKTATQNKDTLYLFVHVGKYGIKFVSHRIPLLYLWAKSNMV